MNHLREAIQLPAPHSAVWLHRVEKLPWGWIVEYEGPHLDVLLAAGCVSQHIVDQLSQPGKVAKFKDEDGDVFTRVKRPLKNVPGRLLIERHIDEDRMDKVKSLPGVRETFERTVEEAERIMRDASRLGRGRPVGRYQRIIDWTSDANVIRPNWTAIQLAVATRSR